MTDEAARVACPACGRRFRVDAGALGEGTRQSARCRGCGAPFVVLRQEGALRAVAPLPTRAAPATPAPAGAPATPRRGRRRLRRSAPAAAAEASAPAPAPGPAAAPPGSGPFPGPVPGPAPGMPFDVGDRVGRYEIEGLLARGGMGGIYKAYDPAANRHVALKVLATNATELDRLRFQREIQVQGNIHHPHIMPIFDSGMLGSTRWFTMELLKEPVDLLRLTDQLHAGGEGGSAAGPLSTLDGIVRDVVLPICDAVYHANVQEAVLHRDIKPGNVLVDLHGLRPFLIDFGVSALLGMKNARLAHLDRELPVPLRGEGVSITGTLVFMPPEQARGLADAHGDVWALGALLHYLVAGEPPLEHAVRPVVSRGERIEGLRLLVDQARQAGRADEAAGYEARIDAIETGRERTVDDLRRDVVRGRYRPRPASTPRALDAIIARAMRPDPTRRYEHARVLRDDLVAWLEGRPVSALVERTGRARSTWYRLRLLARRHRLLAAALLLLATLAVAVVRFWPAGEAPVDRSRLVREHMERALARAERGDLDAARAAARRAAAADPEAREPFDFLARLDDRERLRADVARADTLAKEARRAFAESRPDEGRRRRAALEETLLLRVLPALPDDDPRREQAERLLAYARGEHRLEVPGLPPGARLALVPVTPGPGPVRWDEARDLEPGAPAPVTPGGWVLHVRRERGEVLLPFDVPEDGTSVQVACPVDPALVPPDRVYVGAGTAPGPGGGAPVEALLWDRTEVTVAAYAAFLETLPPEERRRRVPRRAGPLGSPGVPLWDAQGEGFATPAASLRRPVEGISFYDARAFARYAGKRVPTAPEWGWAATGPDGRLAAVGGMRDLLDGAAHVDRAFAGIADVGSARADRNPFGLQDMAGNVAEFTATLGAWRGISGYLVMGGSYRTGPEAAFVTAARPVPGWQPLEGVGLRCVAPAP